MIKYQVERVVMNHAEKQRPWIFLSHSSNDLDKVRLVRNHLEDLGTAPLLFHLLSQNQNGQFWPLIKKEIEARNFFLLCDSENARKSKWVQKEWRAVQRIARKRTVRVGKIWLDKREIDFNILDNFASNIAFSYTKFVDYNSPVYSAVKFSFHA
jgi:TIR domain